MRALVFILILLPMSAMAVKTDDLNKVMFEGIVQDIKQDRYNGNSKQMNRGPASFSREEINDSEVLKKKNKVNGLQDSW